MGQRMCGHMSFSLVFDSRRRPSRLNSGLQATLGSTMKIALAIYAQRERTTAYLAEGPASAHV